jgi:hypothetical protein
MSVGSMRRPIRQRRADGDTRAGANCCVRHRTGRCYPDAGANQRAGHRPPGD